MAKNYSLPHNEVTLLLVEHQVRVNTSSQYEGQVIQTVIKAFPVHHEIVYEDLYKFLYKF